MNSQDRMRQICNRVLYAYNNPFKLTADEYALLLKVHKRLLQDKKRHVVDIDIIIQTFNNQEEEVINRMIEKYTFDRQKDDVVAEICRMGREKAVKAVEDEYFRFEVI